MHQILADHDKQISIQHLRERSTERSCDVNRNEVAYFADVIKQVLAPQHTALLWSLLLLTVTVEPPHHG